MATERNVAIPSRVLGVHVANLTTGGVIMTCCTVLAIGLVAYPLFNLILSSFIIEKGGKAFFSLRNYVQMFSDPRMLRGITNSLFIALGTSAVAGLFGVSLAWINGRTNSFGKDMLEPFNLLPFYVSPLIGAIGWMFLASPTMGLVNKFFLHTLGFSEAPLNIYSRWGIIWVMGIFFTPYMYLFTVGSLQKMDPALEESARTAGASMLRTTLTVTIPLVTPSILFGLVLTFITSVGLFSVPAVLGVPARVETLPVLIWEAIEREDVNFNLASAIGMVMFVMTVIIIVFQRRFIAHRSYTTVTGKGFRPALVDLGRWRWVTFGFNLLYLVVGGLLPLGVLFLVAVSKYWQGYFDPRLFTLQNFKWVLFDFPLTRRAIENSFFLAAVGATVSVVFSVVLSFVLARIQGKGRTVLDFFVNLPVSVPGIVFAMGILVGYIRTPIYATIWILMLAYVTRFLPVSVRTISAVLISISEELEQSSRLCGATWLKTLFRIVWPLIKSGAIAAWLTLFMIFMRELNSSILLFTEGTEVMSIALFVLLEDSPLPHVAAYSLIQVFFMFVSVALFRKMVGTGSLEA